MMPVGEHGEMKLGSANRLQLIIASFVLALLLMPGCDSKEDKSCQGEECEAESGPDCDAIYDKCIGACSSASCQNACEAAKNECENQ
jgi:hypothetical protein